MSLVDKLREAFPALPNVEVYGDDWPDHVAGHVEAAPFHDDNDVTTPRGVDVGFDGDDLPSREGRKNGQEVGSEATNRRIHETVEESRHRSERRPVSSVADSVVYGNETLPDANPRRILIRNANRKQVTVTNQGATLIAVGKGGSIALVAGTTPSPNAVYLPNGSPLSVRVFTHKDEVWVVGQAGGVVDWVEENFD